VLNTLCPHQGDQEAKVRLEGEIGEGLVGKKGWAFVLDMDLLQVFHLEERNLYDAYLL